MQDARAYKLYCSFYANSHLYRTVRLYYTIASYVISSANYNNLLTYETELIT